MIIRIFIPDCSQLKTVPGSRVISASEQGRAHYIGGANAPPPPLESEEGGRVISLSGGEDDKYAHSSLIEHSPGLAAYTAKKFDGTNVEVEDLIFVGIISLIKAISTLKPDKDIKLTIYTSRCIGDGTLVYLRRNNKTRLEVPIDKPLNVDWDRSELLLSDVLGADKDVIYHDIKGKIEKSLLNNAINHLNPGERKIAELRYGLINEDEEKMTQREVIDLLDILQFYISRLEKRVMKRPKKETVRSE